MIEFITSRSPEQWAWLLVWSFGPLLLVLTIAATCIVLCRYRNWFTLRSTQIPAEEQAPEDDSTRKARLLSQLFGIQQRDKDTLTERTCSEVSSFLEEMEDVASAKMLHRLLTVLRAQGRLPPVLKPDDELYPLTKSFVGEVMAAYIERQKNPTK